MSATKRPALHDLLIDLKAAVNKNAIDIEAKLGRALTRELTGTNKRDGWPTSTTGSEGGGGKNRSSSTELAVFGKQKTPDRHRDLVFEAIQDLENIYDAFIKLTKRLESIDDLTKIDVDAKLCESCGGKRAPEHKVDHRGTVGDRLTHVVDLCSDCYQFVVQSADPASRKGRLPTERQISDHEARGRWRINTN